MAFQIVTDRVLLHCLQYIDNCFLLQNVHIHSAAVLTIHPKESAKSSMYYTLQFWKKELASVRIKVSRS
jgi:hypothetical protein